MSENNKLKTKLKKMDEPKQNGFKSNKQTTLNTICAILDFKDQYSLLRQYEILEKLVTNIVGCRGVTQLGGSLYLNMCNLLLFHSN